MIVPLIADALAGTWLVRTNDDAGVDAPNAETAVELLFEPAYTYELLETAEPATANCIDTPPDPSGIKFSISIW